MAKRKTETEMMNEEHREKAIKEIRSFRYQSYAASKPWQDADGNLIWSAWRMKCAQLVFSQTFETTMGLIIVANVALIVHETNQDARCFPEYKADLQECPYLSEKSPPVIALNALFLTLYSLECAVRAYVERSAFIWNKWNAIDLFTVVTGWFGFSVSGLVNVTLLRMFRLVRVARAVRVLISVPEFYLLITGLHSSIKAIIFGALLLLCLILFWSVIAVDLVHPVSSALLWDDCDRCPRSFESIWAASLTLFQQIVAGDSWGEISIRVVEDAPWTAILLFAILITISLGMLNLILAVIVERAAEARENDYEAKIKRKQEDRAKSMEDLASLCASMDENRNGLISYQEMLKGYDEVEEFKKLMEIMDLNRDDMATVFRVLDADSTEEVPYLEFCQHLGSFFKRDPVIMQSLVRYSVLEVRKLLERDVMAMLQQQTLMLQRLLQERPSTVEMRLPALPSLEDELQAALRRAQDVVDACTAEPQRSVRARGTFEAPLRDVARLQERLEILASERVKERVRESGLKWPKCGCEHESEMGVALI